MPQSHDIVHVICPECRGWVECPVSPYRQTGHLRGSHPSPCSYTASGLRECPHCQTPFTVAYVEVSVSGCVCVSIATYPHCDDTPEDI